MQKKILTHLQSFTGYNPPAATLSVAELTTKIQTIKAQNTQTASSIQGYSAAVDTRQKLFQKDNDSLIKIMSAVGSAVRSAYGKSAKEATDIAAMVTKIRGVKIKKASNQPNAEFVSQSERSYGSMTQNFADMLATLENYGDNYRPANTNINLGTLQTKLASLTTANNNVTIAYGQLKEKRDDRSAMYKELTDVTQRIKDAIKSQYGLKSTEYNLIKGLKV